MFPIFWDSGSQWIALDLKSSKSNQVVLFDLDLPEPIQTLYPSFEAMLQAGIKANMQNSKLTCFQRP
jgi:hypothetical protein